MDHLSLVRDQVSEFTKTLLGDSVHEILYNDVDHDDVELMQLPGQPGAAKTWARLTTRFGAAPTASIGGRDTRQSGVITLQVFAPKGRGGIASNDIAVLWVSKLQTERLCNGVFRNGRIQDLGVDKAWYNVNGTVDFEIVAKL